MVTLEQVTKLREYANISFEEAKAALEETNGDILEAIVNLEKQNKIKPPENDGSFKTDQHKKDTSESSHDEQAKQQSAEADSASFGELVGKFLRWCGHIIHKGNINSFEVLKINEKIMSVPVTVLVLLLIFAFWLIIPLLIIGLFFGYRFRFAGPDLGREKVNQAMDSVANAAESFKQDIKGDQTNGKNSDH